MTAYFSLPILIMFGIILLHYFQLNSYQSHNFIKNVYLNFRKIFLFIIVESILYYGHYYNYSVKIHIKISLIYNITLFFIIFLILISRKKKPIRFTNRAVRLFSIYILIIIIFVILMSKYCQYFAQLIILISPFIMLFSNMLLHPYEKIKFNKYIKIAQEKLNEINPIIIGITGSYGKTSTKIYLSQILSSSYDVFMTPSSYNTPLGIAKAIETMPKTCEIFVMEMGARHNGEILELCNYYKPNHGILVGVNNQHIETFKNIKNTVITKTALLNYINENTNDSIAILNADSENIDFINDELNFKTLKVGNGIDNDFAIEIVNIDDLGSTFNIMYNNVTETFVTKLLGKHNIINISLAIAMAIKLGVKVDAIREKVSQIQAIEHRLSITKVNSLTIIDDSFNSNETGFYAALDVLTYFKGKKILVTAGVVELGKEAYNVNINIAKKALTICDYIIVVGKTNKSAWLDGVKNDNLHSNNVFWTETLEEGKEIYKKLLEPNSVILFENDLPDNYR